MVYPVVVTSNVLDWLIDDIHWVAEARSGDRFEVGKCIAAGLLTGLEDARIEIAMAVATKPMPISLK
jgi:hypothetical protein